MCFPFLPWDRVSERVVVLLTVCPLRLLYYVVISASNPWYFVGGVPGGGGAREAHIHPEALLRGAAGVDVGQTVESARGAVVLVGYEDLPAFAVLGYRLVDGVQERADLRAGGGDPDGLGVEPS